MSLTYFDDLDALIEQSPVEVLEQAQELLRDPDRWCVNAHATDQAGNKVRPNSEHATAFSLEGALAWASNDYGIAPPSLLHLLDEAVGRFLSLEDPPGICNTHDAGWFNDQFEHEDVLALLELAKEMASER